MKKLSIAFVVLSVFAGFGKVYACSCAQKTTKQHYLNSTMVFLGEVLSLEEQVPKSFYKEVFVRAADDDFFMSPIGKTREEFKDKNGWIVVKTGHGGGDCGYEFTIAEKYLIFASATAEGELHTGICSGTTHESSAKSLISELEELKASPLDLEEYLNQGSAAWQIKH